MKNTENKENIEPFHIRLRRLRKMRNLTASEFAKQIGIAQSTYSDWENGRGLKIPPYLTMSQVLAIPVTELITGHKPAISELYELIAQIEHNIAELKAKIGTVN